jgi:hypothetical protein
MLSDSRRPKGVHSYTLSCRNPGESDAKASLETVRLGLWKAASAISANPDKLWSWGATGAGGVSTPTSSLRNIAPPESAADVRRMLAETMSEVGAVRMNPNVICCCPVLQKHMFLGKQSV